MKKSCLLRRALGFTGSAVLLAGLLTGFSLNKPGILASPAAAASYQITAGNSYQVDADHLNIRSGPGTQYARQGRLADGAVVKVLETFGSWGRIQEGWICLDYLRPQQEISQNNPIITGYVNAAALNVRKGPGVNYAVCGQIMEGYRVTILETENGWGRTEDGWISMKYVGKAHSSNGSAIPGYENIYVNSKVTVNTTVLNIRQDSGVNYARVGSLQRGTTVTILEIRNNWGRIQEGWICLDYVKPGTGSAGNSVSQTRRVEITASSLRIRTGPGLNYAPCGGIQKGGRVNVEEVRNGWGRISEGWISMDYVRQVS